MKSHPIFWNKVLEEVVKYFDHPILAGGAIRDYKIGVEPKDLDIFVFGCQDVTKVPAWLKEIGQDESNEYASMDSIELVWEGMFEEVKVNVIWMNKAVIPDVSGENLVRTFDFGLTRIWWTQGPPGIGNVTYTEEFRKDLDNLTVTMYIDKKKERSIRRFQRFNERHGNLFVLVDPQGKPVPIPVKVTDDEEIPF